MEQNLYASFNALEIRRESRQQRSHQLITACLDFLKILFYLFCCFVLFYFYKCQGESIKGRSESFSLASKNAT